MKKLMELMAGLIAQNDVAARAELARRQAQSDAATPSPDCALWHDIARALDAKPRTAK